MIRFFAAICVVLSVYSCKKDPSQVSGTNSLVFESEEEVDAVTNFSAFVNLSTLYIENAQPYQNILGHIANEAQGTQINGNGVEISNITISNIHLSAVELYSGYQINDFQTYLEECELFLQYYDFSSSSYVGSSIATLSSVSNSQSKVLFTITAGDLTEFFKLNPDRLYFKFKFNAPPPQDMEAKYRIVFDYSYTYGERELK
jgi:hypothetical protein